MNHRAAVARDIVPVVEDHYIGFEVEDHMDFVAAEVGEVSGLLA